MNKEIPKYIQIKEKIKEEIQSGLITDKLPGERVLAKNMGVSYMTIRKAILDLVEEGILHKQATKGTFVNHSKVNQKLTHNIGFFLDEKIVEGISSPYYSLVFNAIEKEVKKHGNNLILFSDFDDLNPLKSKKKVDGVIICCFPRIEQKIQEIKKFLPIILLDNPSSDKSIPSISIDNFNSVSESINYLINNGHQKIGFMTGLMDSDIAKDRLKGYKAALSRHSLEISEELIFNGDYSYESGEIGAKKLLNQKPRPTAIFCSNDMMAIGALKAIQEAGLSIPKDISVIGFDNIEVASKVFPALTTISAPIPEIAELSVSYIIKAISGKSIDYKHKILPAKLVVRNSTR